MTVAFVHRYDVVKILKVGCHELAARMKNFYPVLVSAFDSPRIGLGTNVKITCATRVNRKFIVPMKLLDFMIEQGFGQRRTANVAETYEENIYHGWS